ncbi:aldose 1-epimerase family protein [Xinfangfangia sp. D13-10-4-6]|uniref:aldose epimerase family protein n=1 Tax=Pseudogemmobacter hezensis TaxID=2737662 RepID=UPI0015564125|nr:aldose 1-epimerase family protein [Pseudogemmobacter hezensis]NPD16368.1 aldose 1-epimerase family protein [Pseudogemmobacter hezensis]
MSAEEIRLTDGHLSALVSPMGAELRSLKYGPAQDELLWQADAAFWDQTAPILFPICGRAIDNQVRIDGRDYPMTIHGFAMESLFTVVAHQPALVRLALSSNPQTRTIYPFDFQLVLEYRLQDKALHCTAEISNTGAQPMPFSFGFHPGFALPLPGADGQPHEVRRLSEGPDPMIAEQRDNFLTGKTLPTVFQDGRLAIADETFRPSSSIIITEGAGQRLYYGPASGRGLEISFPTTENLVLWRPQGAGFLCIEPWQGLPSQIGAGPEIAARPYSTSLAPGETRAFALTVSAERL